jgi:hypothetical protein
MLMSKPGPILANFQSDVKEEINVETLLKTADLRSGGEERSKI